MTHTTTAVLVAAGSSTRMGFDKLAAVVGGKTVGAVGVIGPCRMDYSKVVSAIRYLSDGIAGVLYTPQNGQLSAPNGQGDPNKH